MGALVPIVPRADSGWALFIPLLVAGSGLGLLVSQLNNYTLAPISRERIGAGVNSAAGSLRLSFGLAFAGGIMLATLALTFTNMADSSTVLPPSDQQRVADALEQDAQVMSNTQLEELLADQPEDIQDEIVRINTDARTRALQVACSCRSLPPSSAWPTRSGWCASGTPPPRRPWKVSRWADPQGAATRVGRGRSPRPACPSGSLVEGHTEPHDGSASGTFVDPPAVAQPIQEQETPAASGAVGCHDSLREPQTRSATSMMT